MTILMVKISREKVFLNSSIQPASASAELIAGIRAPHLGTAEGSIFSDDLFSDDQGDPC
jgi:hypothetical protein